MVEFIVEFFIFFEHVCYIMPKAFTRRKPIQVGLDSHMYRVAITGIGIISCLGTTVEDVGDSLRNGKSGIVVDEERIKRGFRSPLTGAIKGFTPHGTLSRKHLKTMPDFAVQAYTAALDAINNVRT